MTRSELIQKLNLLQIPQNCYSFDDIKMGECFSVVKENGRWVIYYAERNIPEKMNSFDLETDAYAYLFKITWVRYPIKSDNTSKDQSLTMAKAE